MKREEMIIASVKYFSGTGENKFFFCKENFESQRIISFSIKFWTNEIEPVIGELVFLSDIRSKLNSKKKQVWFANQVDIFTDII